MYIIFFKSQSINISKTKLLFYILIHVHVPKFELFVPLHFKPVDDRVSQN
jgi:hypothetical protein